MTEPVMKYGARKGDMSGLKKLVSSFSSRQIRVFPVPGADILRTWQTESDSSIVIASSPREANVLLVMGDLPESLGKKAAITYMQIPRPRVLVNAGNNNISPLPKPDIHLMLEEGFLKDAIPEIQQLLQNHSWSRDAKPWEPEFLKKMMEDSDGDDGGHDHHHHHDHGESHEDHDSHNHDHNHQQHDHDEMSGDDEDESERNHQHNHDHGGHDHGGDHDHGDHDHGDMDFMSMVKMTKDLPKPKDGLPMNRSEVHFGPFHPGLPGGLRIFTELDGDTVIKAHVEHDLLTRSIEKSLPLDVQKLPDFLSLLNPLSPKTYRLLAKKALREQEKPFTLKEIVQLENDRVLSHLNWLATFSKTLGSDKISTEAWRLYIRHKSEPIQLEEIYTFLDQIRKMPYLKQKLIQGPGIPDVHLHYLSGPVPKAAGIETDVQSEVKLYQQLGWEPITKNENTPWGRLLVRLEEIEQSLLLMEKAGQNGGEQNIRFKESGHSVASVESPRGRLSLDANIRNGKVTKLTIDAPSTRLGGIIPIITEEMELSDALIQIASLDISPWEMQLTEKEE